MSARDFKTITKSCLKHLIFCFIFSDGGIYSVEDLNKHRTSPYVVNITVKDYYKGFGYNTVGPTQMTIHIPGKIDWIHN